METLIAKRIYAIYDFIDRYSLEYRCAPTLGEIAAEMDLLTGTVRRLLNKMELMGMIQRPKARRRFILLVRRVPNWNALVTPEPGEFPPIHVETVDPVGKLRNYRYQRG